MQRRMTRRTSTTAVVVAVLALMGAACGSDASSDVASNETISSSTTEGNQTSGVDETTSTTAYDPQIDPSTFTDPVANEYFPLTPGSRWVYEGTSPEGTEQVVVRVTDRTKEIMGVETTVVRDTVSVDGVIVEDTLDWYATDNDGAVWYFGEDVQNFDNGQPSDTDGSFESGVDGALPGIVMLADPQPGEHYRQEFYAGEAEDEATILRVGEDTVTVPAGTFDQVLVTEDVNPLDPDNIVENKFYAAGVGIIAEGHVTGPPERIELLEYEIA